jgi:hypothetical protein|tara:strand:- start:193 stop:378 length:186 start_codon:yes stop_codon:yes gene_type:complete
MNKFVVCFLMFFFVSCVTKESLKNKNINKSEIDNIDIISFETFNKKLDIYVKTSDYPDIRN